MVAQMLNMLEPYDLGSMGWHSAAAIHLIVEAERRAFADRAEHLGDPDYYHVPVDMLIDKKYAKMRFGDAPVVVWTVTCSRNTFFAPISR